MLLLALHENYNMFSPSQALMDLLFYNLSIYYFISFIHYFEQIAESSTFFHNILTHIFLLRLSISFVFFPLPHNVVATLSPIQLLSCLLLKSARRLIFDTRWRLTAWLRKRI